MLKLAIPELLKSANAEEGVVSDVADDKAAWDVCIKEIRAEAGANLGLDELLQGLALRSKEPRTRLPSCSSDTCLCLPARCQNRR
jgi:hypothetical protein